MRIYYIINYIYLLIDLEGGNVPLSLVANQRRAFREIRHCDWPKVEHFHRRGRLVDIFLYIQFKYTISYIPDI